MEDLLGTIGKSGSSKLGAVLHLGAGRCRELEGYLPFNPDKIVLVEANPEIVEELKIQVRGVRQAEIINAAVANAEGEASLLVLNNPRESSLFPPATLLKHYPNLIVIRSISVSAVNLSQLVKRLSPDASFDNLLVLEVQGAEVSVLSSAPPEALQKFCWIAVRASIEALYEGGARLGDVNALLRRSGFRAMPHACIETGFLFRNALYRRDSLLVCLQALKSENATLMQRTALLEAELARLEQKLVEARQNVSLSAKLQALREADLKDLQNRYRKSFSIQESQHQILVKLGERLREASTYLHQMADSHAMSMPGIEEKPGREPKRTIQSRSAGSRSNKVKGGA